jgi:hypothetical protein
VEADLARFYRIDYRDRWRPDEHGRPLLTLRRLLVLVQHLPPDAACVARLNDGKVPWSRTDQLLDEVRRRLDRLRGVKRPKPDPNRPMPTARPPTPTRARRLAAARRRARERRRQIKKGEIT